MDTSNGVNNEMKNKIERFLINQADVYNISANHRFSIITYGSRPNTILPLDKGISRGSLTSALSSLALIGGDRHLETALQQAKDVILSKARDRAGKVVVVAMAGPNNPSSTAQLNAEATALKETGTEVVVVGIGNDVVDEEMERIASNPDNVLKVKSTGELNEATATISASSSKAAMTMPRLDVGFIIGADGGTAEQDFNIAKNFMNRLGGRLKIARDQARVALIQSGRDARMILRLDQGVDAVRVRDVLKRVQLGAKGFELRRAIELAKEEFFRERNNGRKAIPKILFIFVNQRLSPASIRDARALLAQGVRIVVVSIGRQVRPDDVKDITGTADDVIGVESIQDVNEATAKAITAIVPGMLISIVLVT